MPDEITIRLVTDYAEMQQLEAVQRKIWRGSENVVIHTHWMITLARSGGIVLGAFDGKRAVGFLFSLLGTDEPFDGRPAMVALKHASKRMGVLPAYQNRGIGLRLKRKQRELAIQQGVHLITWTFDPLRSRNAYLNIHKLGAVARCYLRDCYGAFGDAQNAGVPTDRLYAEWWVTKNRVKQRLSGARGKLSLEQYLSGNVPILNPAQFAPDDALSCPCQVAAAPESLMVLVEVPANFDAILAHDLTLANLWRKHTRAVFESAFAAGYVTTDFVYEEMDGWPRGFYVLSLIGEDK